jgi:hypothetical protein
LQDVDRRSCDQHDIGGVVPDDTDHASSFRDDTEHATNFRTSDPTHIKLENPTSGDHSHSVNRLAENIFPSVSHRQSLGSVAHNNSNNAMNGLQHSVNSDGGNSGMYMTTTRADDNYEIDVDVDEADSFCHDKGDDGSGVAMETRASTLGVAMERASASGVAMERAFTSGVAMETRASTLGVAMENIETGVGTDTFRDEEKSREYMAREMYGSSKDNTLSENIKVENVLPYTSDASCDSWQRGVLEGNISQNVNDHVQHVNYQQKSSVSDNIDFQSSTPKEKRNNNVQHYRQAAWVSNQTQHDSTTTSITSPHRKYTCSVCAKGFQRPADLTVHMRIHTGNKPYKCAICGRAFTQSHSLKTHTRLHTRESERERERHRDTETQRHRDTETQRHTSVNRLRTSHYDH